MDKTHLLTPAEMEEFIDAVSDRLVKNGGPIYGDQSGALGAQAPGMPPQTGPSK